MALVADRRAEAWRLFILASLGICAVLVVGAAIFFLQGVSEAQSAFRRYVALLDRRYLFQDDPRGFQPYVMIALLIASSSVAAIGAWKTWRRRLRSAARLLNWAALGFVLCTWGAMWSSSILHPCFDDGTFYDCTAWVAGDRIALATLLLAVTAILCRLTAMRASYLALRMPTMNNPGEASQVTLSWSYGPSRGLYGDRRRPLSRRRLCRYAPPLPFMS